MGLHLLNGVKCVREVWGLTNALIMCTWHAGQLNDSEVMIAMSIVNYLRGGGIVMHGGLLTTKRVEKLLTAQRVFTSFVPFSAKHMMNNKQVSFTQLIWI